MNVLCVAAHPDDELLGCGATLRKLRDAGHHIYTCILCGSADARHARPDLERLQSMATKSAEMVGVEETARYDFRNIHFNTVPHLEMVQAVEEAILRFRPSWVFTHHPSDLNIDHRVCYETTMAAVRLPQRMSHDLPATMIERVFLFEVLSSTDWAPPIGTAFQPNSFFDVADTMQIKLDALDAFEGALKPFPHSRSRENLQHLAYLRGGQAGVRMAEAFCLVRDINL
jgi:LmbE family N-acetylglucosaminyl deacetylase